MTDDIDYCETLVRDADKDRFLATLFAPPTRRSDLFSLYAFDLGLHRAAFDLGERLGLAELGEQQVQLRHVRLALLARTAAGARVLTLRGALERLGGRLQRREPLLQRDRLAQQRDRGTALHARLQVTLEQARDLLRRVREGDEQAAAELVRTYEPAIRVAVRVRLTDARLRRLVDSIDICQSVLANFFVRAASGQFELERADQLVKLLVTMARNRVVNEAHKQQAARRDQRRLEAGALHENAVADDDPSPSQIVANRELLGEFRSRLTEQERQIADLRSHGRAWPEIAADLGQNPEALRMRYTRAMNRVARELGLEE